MNTRFSQATSGFNQPNTSVTYNEVKSASDSSPSTGLESLDSPVLVLVLRLAESLASSIWHTCIGATHSQMHAPTQSRLV